MCARWVATAIALMLSCYGLIGRAEAYLVNVDWKFICSDEPQKFWQIYLPYWQHFCSVENGSIGANAAIRGNDTDTQPVISLFFWNMAPNAVRFEWRYLTPTFSLIFFRRDERVGRTFQRVFWSPTLRAGELASMDGCVDQLLKPIVRVFVVPNVCSRNTVDHIQRGYFSNVAALQFYKKRDAFFSVELVIRRIGSTATGLMSLAFKVNQGRKSRSAVSLAWARASRLAATASSATLVEARISRDCLLPAIPVTIHRPTVETERTK